MKMIAATVVKVRIVMRFLLLDWARGVKFCCPGRRGSVCTGGLRANGGFMRILLLLVAVLTMPAMTWAEVFTAEPLPQATKREYLQRGFWHASCPLSLDRLTLLKISYVDFAGTSHDDGQLIVMDAVADQVVALFRELHRRKFPIAKMQPTSVYRGDDKASMADNNTSAYNCRMVMGGEMPSMHAYGLAIDINTVQNPFIFPKSEASGAVEILPPQGAGYLNRANRRPGMAEEIAATFARYGFSVWGGTWNNPIDWQHFQPSRTMAQLLTAMTPAHARTFFALYTRNPTMLTRAAYDKEGLELVKLYQRNPDHFVQVFQNSPGRLSTLEPSEAVKFLDLRVAQRK